MRPFRLWQRVGSPTWKRSGTLVFAAVMGVLLIGGTAMAANLGLLTAAKSGSNRGYRLEVPRPALSVTLPTTVPSPPSVDSTSVSEEVTDPEVDVDDDGIDDLSTGQSPTEDESGDVDDESEDDSTSSSSDDDDADDDDDVDDADDDDDVESSSERHAGDPGQRSSVSQAPGGKHTGDGFSGDGRLDDD